MSSSTCTKPQEQLQSSRDTVPSPSPMLQDADHHYGVLLLDLVPAVKMLPQGDTSCTSMIDIDIKIHASSSSTSDLHSSIIIATHSDINRTNIDERDEDAILLGTTSNVSVTRDNLNIIEGWMYTNEDYFKMFCSPP
eukprot:15070048-Ditylum_brightwellii.AAC.1